MEPSLACAVRGTTDRMAEVIIFCNRQWQFKNENPKLEPLFLDANMSLRSMLAPKVASGVANPWKTILGCLTESCKVFMRRCRDQDPTTMEYIFLTGVELMQLVGWHRVGFAKEWIYCLWRHRVCSPLSLEMHSRASRPLPASST